MSSAVLSSPTWRLYTQGRELRADKQIRQQSRAKRSEILEHISRHPDADEGLRRQAEFYRRRLEAGMEHSDDA
jgi:hypothetical protein